MRTCCGTAQVFPNADQPLGGLDVRDAAEENVGNVCPDAMNVWVIQAISIGMLVPRRALVNHDHVICRQVDGLAEKVTELSLNMKKEN